MSMSVTKKFVAVAASVFLAFLGVPLISLDSARAEEAPAPLEVMKPVADEPASEAGGTGEDPAASATPSPQSSVADEAAAPAAQADAAQPVAEVVTDSGTTSYPSLKDAVAAAPEGSTVNLLADADLPAYNEQGANISLLITKGITLDGNGHTLTVHKNGVYLLGGDDEAATVNFVIRNITITNPDSLGRTLSLRAGYKTVKCEDATLATTGTGNTQVVTVGANTPQTTDISFDGCTITASEAGYGIITFNPVNLTIADSDVSGYAALYMKGPDYSTGSSNSVVNIEDGSKLSSKGIPGPTNEFGTIVIQECSNVKVNVTGSTVEAQSNSETGAASAPQAVVLYSSYGDDTTVAHDNKVTFGEGSMVNATGTNSILATVNGKSNAVDATAGTYNLEGSVTDDASAAPADSPTKVTVTGGHWNKDMQDYVPADYVSKETQEDPNAPFTVAPKATEPTDPDDGNDPSHHAGDGDQATDPDDGEADKDAQAGDDQDGNAADADADADKDAATTAHNGGTNGTSSTSAYRSGTGSTYRASTSGSRSFPRTADDSTPLLAGVGALALAAAATAVVATRKMRKED